MMVMKMKYSAMLQSLQKTQTQNLVFSEIYLLKRLYQSLQEIDYISYIRMNVKLLGILMIV